MIDNSVRWVQRPSLLEDGKGLTPGAANSIPRRKATLKEFSGNAFFGLWPYAGQGVFENFPILSGVAGGVGGAKAKSGLGLCVLCQREREEECGGVCAAPPRDSSSLSTTLKLLMTSVVPSASLWRRRRRRGSVGSPRQSE